MHRLQIACDGSRPTVGELCPRLDLPPDLTFKDAAAWAEAALKENGWTTVGDKHFCPEHNPAAKGIEVTIHRGAYTEIAPGVNVRLPVNAYVQQLIVEVQHDDRECHGNVGAVCGGGTGPYGV